MVPPELSNLKVDKTLYNKVVKFLKENDPEMIYIYGGDDPWTASGVTWPVSYTHLMELHNLHL